ncbi:MAG: M20/M25/M40 family metallo-hydrolase [Flavobacteriaceae bacterium]|nr:M20/M25/M40 family metallo-hydrolase [Flavobacteriaceae bacterium]
MRLIVASICSLILFSCAQDTKKSITMKEDVVVLSSDDMQGRETGTAGELKAADYIAQRFEDNGLLAKGTDGYFQDFTFKPSSNPHEETEFLTDRSTDSTVTGRNVVAYLDNGAERTVAIGAHYDHLGMGGFGSLHRGENAVHNGADDNASGIAMLLRLALELKENEIKEQNNYVFIAFSGEEMGLLGSSYWVKNATLDISTVNYMINMDMVGRLNEENTLAVHGVGTSPIFKQTLMSNNEGLNLSEFESGIGPSDFTSFYVYDIPVLSFFTGQHEDYHKPDDDAEKLNYEGMDMILGYIERIIMDLDDNGKLAFRKTKNESEEVPAFKVGLGVVPDYLYTGKGMRIDGVSEDKPAQKAGLLKGDVVKKMGDSTVIDLMSYMKVLSTFENGQKTKVVVERDGEMIEVEVEF